MNDSERQFIEHVRASLDERAARLDPHLVSRLRAARSQALEAGSSRMHYGWASAAGTALALVMALGIWSTHDVGQQTVTVPKLTYTENPADLEILTMVDSPELFKNLDFYRWLAQQEQPLS